MTRYPPPPPSSEYVAGSLTALDRDCPVKSCLSRKGAACTTTLTMRPLDKRADPVPITLTGPHYERVLNVPPSN